MHGTYAHPTKEDDTKTATFPAYFVWRRCKSDSEYLITIVASIWRDKTAFSNPQTS